MQRRYAIQLFVVVICLLPFARLGYGFWRGELGANPIEELTHETGTWALRLLVVSLTITPARRLLSMPSLAPLRRSFGLLAFFYAALHLLTYLVLDQGLDWTFVVEDVIERPFVTAGMISFLCMLPLAITSTRGWIRRLGRRWVKLHRLAYAAGVAAVLHYLWLVKADLREPLLYAAALAVLLAARLLFFKPAAFRSRTRARAR